MLISTSGEALNWDIYQWGSPQFGTRLKHVLSAVPQMAYDTPVISHEYVTLFVPVH